MKKISIQLRLVLLCLLAFTALNNASYAQPKFDLALPVSVKLLQSRTIENGNIVRLIAHSDLLSRYVPSEIKTPKFLLLEYWNSNRTQLLARMYVEKEITVSGQTWDLKEIDIFDIESFHANSKQAEFLLTFLQTGTANLIEADCTVYILEKNLGPLNCQEAVTNHE